MSECDCGACNMRRGAERFRLAWRSARQRAMNHLLALVESDEKRDELEAELRHLYSLHEHTVEERDEARAEVVRLGRALQKAADDQCGCLGTMEV
ncbi:hypothetical protein Drose_04475 [Dactylosporangium roseum]|uniref:Uncharacterized protein n=1 Tax=Dactylosporangium roseum TaxID=47989 RepID=A0ABY5Z957_9ACTN|nr:hypothetical protein [Dactylosporangium roseum]UWZ37545.1 hypothetical protein Drose_04475 [Dactylosporangium roseum]